MFAKSNKREDILNAVKQKLSVAVDTISKEYRLVGEFRYIKYASFLMENYFPIHDRQAFLDGEILFDYFCGNATKEDVEFASKRAKRLIKKYFVVKK